jgi:tetratricopeptide (TPR) repeat protein
LDDVQATRSYAAAWRAIMQLVRSGSSWSGRERNCAFLNCASSGSEPTAARFANVSAVSGLDFDDDARGLAVVDWDHDGDLDLWFRNRTAPRMRLMLNRSNQLDPSRPFVAVRLIGTRCNRDAIGARVELVCEDLPTTQRRVQTVRAGDAFLSQSSKWLHFGLGQESGAIRELIVDWPGGQRERFTGISAPGRYQISEGSGVAVAAASRAPLSLPPRPPQPLEPSAAARVVLPGQIALPTLDLLYLDKVSGGGAGGQPFQPGQQPTLLMLWSSSCPNCRQELADLTQRAEAFRNARLDVLAVCLDGLSESSTAAATAERAVAADAQEFLGKIGFPYASATITARSLDRLRLFQNTLFDQYPDFVVPFSLLVDRQGQVRCIYRGAFSCETLLGDRQLVELSTAALRDRATPLAGSWFTKPATPSQFAEYVGQRLYANDPEEGLRYLELAVAAADDAGRREQLRQQVVRTRLTLARGATAARDAEQAEHHFAAALRIDPNSAPAHHDYAVYAASQGDWATAEQHLRTALRLRPDYPEAEQNLKRLLQRERQ